MENGYTEMSENAYKHYRLRAAQYNETLLSREKTAELLGVSYETLRNYELGITKVTFFDKNNKRNKVIERDKRTGKWHAHHGYEHSEYSEKSHDPLTSSDKKILDKALKEWQNRK